MDQGAEMSGSDETHEAETSGSAEGVRSEQRTVIERQVLKFKETFSRKDVAVHFIGVW